MTKTQQLFFALLSAGLWEKTVQLVQYDQINLSEVLVLAQEQSVVGLVAAGLGFVKDSEFSKQDVLRFIGKTLQLEQLNSAMNLFIERLVDNMQVSGIETILLKGQGIARCYELPLWRSCGDVDFLLSEDNYIKAKSFLIPKATSVETEELVSKHLGLRIESWVVELHGSMHCGLSSRMDKMLNEIWNEVCIGNSVRTWTNGSIDVKLPSAGNDAIYVFTHILNHFYKGGIGVRQICDWCRLLWTYRSEIDYRVLETRIRKMGIMTEWKAFGAFAVEYLGMPVEAMPFYSPARRWKRKADRLCSFFIAVGNFGHNRDMSYYRKSPFLVRKTISLCMRIGDLFRHSIIFPLDSIRFFPSIMLNGLRSAVNS